MPNGILICGLNGSGKSTLGKALSEKLGYRFIDNEDLYFPKSDPSYPYSTQRTKDEVKALLFREISLHEKFIFASVKGDYGEDFYPYLKCAVLIEVPKNIRMQRIRERSYKKFGDRMLKGGDLFEAEERFYKYAQSRDENTVTDWITALKCPIIRLDGTKPIEESLLYLTEELKSLGFR